MTDIEINDINDIKEINEIKNDELNTHQKIIKHLKHNKSIIHKMIDETFEALHKGNVNSVISQIKNGINLDTCVDTYCNCPVCDAHYKYSIRESMMGQKNGNITVIKTAYESSLINSNNIFKFTIDFISNATCYSLDYVKIIYFLISKLIDCNNDYNCNIDSLKSQEDRDEHERLILIGSDQYGDDYYKFGGSEKLFRHYYTDYYNTQQNIFHKILSKFDSTDSNAISELMKICDLLKSNGFDFSQCSFSRSKVNGKYVLNKVTQLDHTMDSCGSIVKFILENTLEYKDRKFNIDIIERRLKSFVKTLKKDKDQYFVEKKYYDQYIKYNIEFFETCVKYGLDMNSVTKSKRTLKEIITTSLKNEDEIKYFDKLLS